MNKAHLLIGGNMGDRLKNLRNAAIEIEQSAGSIVRESRVYETAAWGVTEQPSFLNKVIVIETRLRPTELLSTLLEIEEQLGRKRLVKFGPRLIDIDILFFNDEVVTSNNLVIPHPELQNRRFALTPLAEIEPNFIHPVLKKTVSNLLDECPDQLEVKIFSC